MAMTDEDREKLRPHLQTVSLPNRKILYNAEDAIDRIYFPTDCVISQVGVFADGSTAEMAAIGREGLIPSGLILDDEKVLNRHVVEVPGSALLIRSTPFRRILNESQTLRALLLGYIRALMGQIMQTAACNASHSVEERFARWLLMSHDRVSGDAFSLTQETLSEMLSVHRPTVTLVARGFQRAGLIDYRRGFIRVIDRPGIEELVCECYGIIRGQYLSRIRPVPG